MIIAIRMPKCHLPGLFLDLQLVELDKFILYFPEKAEEGFDFFPFLAKMAGLVIFPGKS